MSGIKVERKIINKEQNTSQGIQGSLPGAEYDEYEDVARGQNTCKS